ncbi:MAG: type II toxin-antitoxin system VapC family toxin [Gammaproteobacteria bacterium]|nr:type II toxin-antitoxin system VapC family toxin [Gammaproteobacteria bacterium]MDE0455127.1 type II toxin-antitoxin system VapC family toxin [Gammaproteobacteria bacterium]
MRITVDASIVIKWFVVEPSSQESRLLLTRHSELLAPDLLLPEFANTIWKKVRRREIADPDPFLSELHSLSELIELYPADVLIERASQLAFEIDHPVYDCLYLACAEVSGTPLVTADNRLVARADESQSGLEVRNIGAPATARWIKDAIAAPG